MLKKRFIGVVTVKNGWAVQSFGYERYLPLGKVECVVENLDRWGADEILVQVIDRSRQDSGPDFDLLGKLARLGLGTPLVYGGGIRSATEAVRVIQSGADRVAVDALLHRDLNVVHDIGLQLGAQAVIACMPMAMGRHDLEWYDYATRTARPVTAALRDTFTQGVVSEVLLTDWRHEGQPMAFDENLIAGFPIRDIPLIAFGGISSTEQMRRLYVYPQLVAVAVGNFLSYREHAVQQFKNELASAALRPSSYASDYSLQAHVL